MEDDALIALFTDLLPEITGFRHINLPTIACLCKLAYARAKTIKLDPRIKAIHRHWVIEHVLTKKIRDVDPDCKLDTRFDQPGGDRVDCFGTMRIWGTMTWNCKPAAALFYYEASAEHNYVLDRKYTRDDLETKRAFLRDAFPEITFR